MTINEIIRAFDCMTTHSHKCMSCIVNPHPGMIWPYGCIEGQNRIIKNAKKALILQIPKPVKRSTEKEESPYCPNTICGNRLVEGQNYCEHCGQALDWGKNERIDRNETDCG